MRKPWEGVNISVTSFEFDFIKSIKYPIKKGVFGHRADVYLEKKNSL